MNVLIAADYATPGSGNFIGSLMELGKVMREQGDDLFFIFPKSPNTQSENSWVNWLKGSRYSVYLIDKERNDSEQLAELNEIILKHDINILHLHFGIYHRLVLRHRNCFSAKILVHDHMDFSYGVDRRRQILANSIKSIVYRLLKIGVVSVNPHKNNSYKFAKHWYIANGLSFSRNLEKSAARDVCRNVLGIKTTEKLCLFLGWDLQRKGLDIALRALAECRKTDSSIILGIVGVGSPPKEWTLDYIHKHTDIDPYSEWIHYLPSTEDMFAYHRAADVYLSASRSEAFSYGILEAISQNTPVVVSDIPGTRWSYEFDHTFSYPVEDYVACAAAVQKALIVGKSDSNSVDITEKYSVKKWCREIIDVYTSL